MQLSFSELNEQNKKVLTKKALFLSQMNAIIPWADFVALIKPHYYASYNPKGGRKPYPIETMLRIYFLQQWYNLADQAVEEFLYDMPLVRHFAQVDINRIPDETTVLNFRRIIENHQLSEQFLALSNTYLEAQGVKVSKGTIMDATIIRAPSSTKNKQQARDPEMASTKKNHQFYFGAKFHIGVDLNSNVIHTATITPANESDIGQMPTLLRPEDEVIMADAGYSSISYKRGARHLGLHFLVNDKRLPSHTKNKKINLSKTQKTRNRKISQVRAKVEHCFRVLKCQFGYNKVRYKGQNKNRVQMLSLFTLVNFYTQREKLMLN